MHLPIYIYIYIYIYIFEFAGVSTCEMGNGFWFGCSAMCCYCDVFRLRCVAMPCDATLCVRVTRGGISLAGVFSGCDHAVAML